jgi:cyclophilin family peptidyl-prolyl cis-trans isomerase
LDRTGLARFSTGRYLVIWAAFLILFLGAILFLIYSTQSKPVALPKYMLVDTAKGSFKIQLYTDPADKVADVVRNFADKARAGYFNGKTFHRVEDWVVQGGDPTGTGRGGGSITAEYNQKPFVRGSVGVASTAGGGSQINDSQWFVVKDAAAATGLVGQYSNFGQVVEGMDVVDKLAVGDVMTKVTVADQ